MHKSTCHDNLKNELLSADFQQDPELKEAQ